MKNDSHKFLPSQIKVDNCTLAGLGSGNAKVVLADVTVLPWNGEKHIFRRVFFVESSLNCAWIAGSEIETLTQRHPKEAPVQQELIAFLRMLNLQEQAQFGTVLTPSTARDSNEARVTQAYLDARGLQYDIRIGYHNADSVFRVAVLMATPACMQQRHLSGHGGVTEERRAP